MKHLIPLTTDQLEIIESSLQSSNKHSQEVDDLLDVIDQNSDYVLWKDKDDIIEKCIEENQQ